MRWRRLWRESTSSATRHLTSVHNAIMRKIYWSKTRDINVRRIQSEQVEANLNLQFYFFVQNKLNWNTHLALLHIKGIVFKHWILTAPHVSIPKISVDTDFTYYSDTFTPPPFFTCLALLNYSINYLLTWQIFRRRCYAP